MRRRAMALTVLAIGAVLGAATEHRSIRPPGAVVRPSAANDTLEAKFAWALGQLSKMGSERPSWVGYSIDRLQGERSHIGRFVSGGAGRDLSIAEVLAGKTAPAAPVSDGEVVRKAARAALDEIEARGKPENKVLRELGIFLRFDAGQKPALTEVQMSNLDLAFDFEGGTLFWLGQAPEDRSLALIAKLYGSHPDNGVREGLIAAAGCHGSPERVVPFLAGILAGDGSDELRRDAAFWIGQQNDAEGLRQLVKTARSDRSEDVREGAVFAISQVQLPAAADEMIGLARNAERRDVRKKAIFWLGQMASEMTCRALEEFARTDGDLEVQEQAVFALSQLPANEGVDVLIKLAKTHPDPRIRKKAVFWLGECDDPRALETLIAIIKGK